MSISTTINKYADIYGHIYIASRKIEKEFIFYLNCRKKKKKKKHRWLLHGITHVNERGP